MGRCLDRLRFTTIKGQVIDFRGSVDDNGDDYGLRGG